MTRLDPCVARDLALRRIAERRYTCVVEINCPVVELRQYIMQPGRRDEMITLFEEAFVEAQEDHGMTVLGQFRNRHDPDRFVWMRGFADMETRRRALEGFYGGAVWKQHRDAANATIIDNDDVLLLRPARAASGLRLDPANRPPRGAAESPGRTVVAAITFLDSPAGESLMRHFEGEVAPALRAAGAVELATLVTEPSPNTFPRLPVREGEQVFMWLGAVDGEASVAPLRRRLDPHAQVLELVPTRRSLLR